MIFSSRVKYAVILGLLFHFGDCGRISRGEPDPPSSTSSENSTLLLRMPDVVPKKNDDYLCMPFKMGDRELFITHFKANATADRAHHILLFGCSSVPQENQSWDCGHHGVCTGTQSILFAWAKNAPPTELPPSVGFRIGGSTAVKYLVMQIHYAHPLPQGESDRSGLDLSITTEEQKYIAGIHLMVAQNVVILPHQPKFHADVNCRVSTTAPLHLFGFRVHAHKLGSVITGYRITNGKMEEIARGNPQWPQAFYPMKQVFDVDSGDYLAARCTFNSTEKTTPTYIGSTAGDEMCNLYLMYYTDAKQGTPYGVCVDQQVPSITNSLPADSDEPLPPNPLLEEHAIHGVSHDTSKMDHSHMGQDNTSVNLEEINYQNLFGKEAEAPENNGGNSTMLLRMPGVVPKKDDDYLCMPFKLTDQQLFITHFKANATADRAHHILLYGCSSVIQEDQPWDCGHHGVCTGTQSILFAWAKNAPPTELPPSVGFRMGGSTAVKYLVMQIHYAHPLPQGEVDRSGLDLTVTTEEQKYIGGIHLMLAQNVIILPQKPKFHADINCKVRTPATMHLFGFRTHAHKLGRVITGYRITNGKMEEIARGNPQWPQAFYPMKQVFDVNNGDYLAARCTYNSTEKTTATFIGSTAGDEMCNLYLMYYTDAKQGTPYGICVDEEVPSITKGLPADSDEPLPPNPLLEEHALHGASHDSSKMDHGQMGQDRPSANLEEINYQTLFGNDVQIPEKKGDNVPHIKRPLNDADVDPAYANDQYDDTKLADYDYKQSVPESSPKVHDKVPVKQVSYEDKYVVDRNWPAQMESQPSAVAVDSTGNVIVFHRANRVWDQNTFTYDNRLRNSQLGPIADPTLILMDSKTGRIVNKAGMGMFYLPHGLTVDHEDNLWVTDVGAHQVFKLTALNSSVSSVQVLLELGKTLQPGSDSKHFCKPTSVAVMPSGDFFVADGYCNSRVVKYDKKGNRLFEWGEPPRKLFGMTTGSTGPNTFNIPHSLALIADKEILCVADRENGRILCYSVADGSFRAEIKRPEFHTVYGIAARGTTLYAVNNAYGSDHAQGFIMDTNQNGALVEVFATSPGNDVLGQPHWMAVSKDESEIYVAEIHPFRIDRFVKKTAVKNADPSVSPAALVTEKHVDVQTTASSSSSSSVLTDANLFASWGIVLSVIGVPMLFFVLVMTIMKLRKRGCCSRKSSKGPRLDLGSLLGRHDPSRGGFEKLALDDSDIDHLDSESDSDAEVVEFSKTNKNRGLKA